MCSIIVSRVMAASLEPRSVPRWTAGCTLPVSLTSAEADAEFIAMRSGRPEAKAGTCAATKSASNNTSSRVLRKHCTLLWTIGRSALHFIALQFWVTLIAINPPGGLPEAEASGAHEKAYGYGNCCKIFRLPYRG